jgi:hypothetical protein
MPHPASSSTNSPPSAIRGLRPKYSKEGERQSKSVDGDTGFETYCTVWALYQIVQSELRSRYQVITPLRESHFSGSTVYWRRHKTVVVMYRAGTNGGPMAEPARGGSPGPSQKHPRNSELISIGYLSNPH